MEATNYIKNLKDQSIITILFCSLIYIFSLVLLSISFNFIVAVNTLNIIFLLGVVLGYYVVKNILKWDLKEREFLGYLYLPMLFLLPILAVSSTEFLKLIFNISLSNEKSLIVMICSGICFIASYFIGFCLYILKNQMRKL
ncbi:hypothetical protein Metin_1315 [Methanocaldococcus infernus ME]|uniref:Uncharacterized protein n=1 Tax=Methanocaldococcus infernus (strain DSM 11812 / JCM 15783 / ME) TaxID=573063 RepID=D5VTR2_METIM|nr:hypothetical protein [Methanocaldococcus infernus]ADG13965.1 hypothetical protein Metin_1315 [Methanocaldococcus infernus ME]